MAHPDGHFDDSAITSAYVGMEMFDAGMVLQDAMDGAALRRLREALGEGASVDVQCGAHPYKDEWAILYTPEPDAMASSYYGGATIAEAADKCREALG